MKKILKKIVSVLAAAAVVLPVLTGMTFDQQTISATSSGSNVIVPGQAAIDVFINAGHASEFFAGDLYYNDVLKKAIEAEFDRLRDLGEFTGPTPAIRISASEVELDINDLEEWHVYDHFDSRDSRWSAPANPTGHGIPSYGRPFPNHSTGDLWKYLGQEDSNVAEAGVVAPACSESCAPPAGSPTGTPTTCAGARSPWDWCKATFNNFKMAGSAQEGEMPVMRLYDWVYRTYANPSNTTMVKNGRPTTHSTGVDTLGIFDRHILTSYDPDLGPRIDFVGYYNSPVQDFILYPSESKDTKQVRFEISSAGTNAHTLDGAGFLLNAGIDDSGRLHGYLLYYVFPGMETENAVPSHLMLYKIGQTSTGGVFTSGIAVADLRSTTKTTATGGLFNSPSNSSAKINNNYMTTVANGAITGANGMFTPVNVAGMTEFRIQTSGTNNTAALVAGNSYATHGFRVSNKWNNDSVYNPGTQTAAPVTGYSAANDIWQSKMEIDIIVNPRQIIVKQRPYGTENWTEVLNHNILLADRTEFTGFGPYVGYNLHGCTRASQFTYSNLKMQFLNRSDNIYDVVSNAPYIQNADKYFVDLTYDGNNRDLSNDQGGNAAAYMQAAEVEYITNNPNRCGGVGEICGTGTGDECPSTCDSMPKVDGPDDDDVVCCYDWDGAKWVLECESIVCANHPYSHYLTRRTPSPTPPTQAETDALAKQIAEQIVDSYLRKLEETERQLPRHRIGLDAPVASLTLVRDLAAPEEFVDKVQRDLIGVGGGSPSYIIYGYDRDSTPSDGESALDTPYEIIEWFYRIEKPGGAIITRSGAAASVVDTIETSDLSDGGNEKSFAYTSSYGVENQGGMATLLPLLNITNNRTLWPAGTYTVYLMVKDDSGDGNYNYSTNIQRTTFEIVEDLNAPEIPEITVDFSTRKMNFTTQDIDGDKLNHGVGKYEIIVTPTGGSPTTFAQYTLTPEQTAVSKSGPVRFDNIDIPAGSAYTWQLKVTDIVGNETIVPLPVINGNELSGIPNGQTGITGKPATVNATPPATAPDGKITVQIDPDPTADDSGEIIYTTAGNNVKTNDKDAPAPYTNNKTKITAVIPTANMVTVLATVDGDPWTNYHGEIQLPITLVPIVGGVPGTPIIPSDATNGNVFTNASIATGTKYKVFVEGKDMGVEFTVEAGANNVVIPYFTLTLNALSGTEDPVQTPKNTLLPGEGIVGTPTDAQSVGRYLAGTEVNINVNVEALHVFDEWDSPQIANESNKAVTITMPAEFVVMNAKAHGSEVKIIINKDGSAWDDNGKTVTLEDATDETKVFDTPVVDDEVVKFNGVPEGIYKILVDGEDTGETVEVKDVGGVIGGTAILNYYTLTLVAEPGTSNPDGGGIYLAGTEVDISVLVGSDYTWGKWTPDVPAFGDRNTQNTTITMPAYPLTLTASASQGYEVVIDINKDGEPWDNSGKIVTLVGEDGTVYTIDDVSGNEVTFDSIPAGDYKIFVDGEDTGKTITVEPDGSITGTTTLEYFTLTLIAGTNTNTTDGSGFYLAGTQVDISVAVNSGRTWNRWTPDPNPTSFGNVTARNTTITMPAHALTLTATATGGGGGGGGSTTNTPQPQPEPPAPAPAPEAPKFPVTIIITKDNEPWNDSDVPKITLRDADGKTHEVKDGVPSGDYKILHDGVDTGKVIVVDDKSASATLNYYTLTLITGEGTGDAKGYGVFLEGTPVDISVLIANGFDWAGWLSLTGGFGDINESAASFIMPAFDIVLRANVVQSDPDSTGEPGDVNPHTGGVTAGFISAIVFALGGTVMTKGKKTKNKFIRN